MRRFHAFVIALCLMATAIIVLTPMSERMVDAQTIGGQTQDNTAFTYGTSLYGPIGGVYNSSITALTSGRGGAVALTANRSMHTLDDNSASMLTAIQAGTQADNSAWTAGTTSQVGIGCQYTSAGATVLTTGNAGMVACDSRRNLVTTPYSLPGQTSNLAPAGQTGTSAITIFAASGTSGISEYMTSIQIGRSDNGTTAITATVTDGTLSFVWVVPNSGGGGGNNITFPTPIKFATNHAVTCTASGGVTTFYCYAQGFNAP